MAVKIKICGIKSPADVEACRAAGVDFVGFNFFRNSPRYIEPAQAAALVRGLPASISSVGVFVQAPPEEVQQICELAGIKTAQLHGDESLQLYEDLDLELLQVVRVREGAKVGSLLKPSTMRAVLDTHVPGFGGEGRSMDWSLAAHLQRHWGIPLILAGGLSPENVQVAIRTAKPWGVDVATGVEDERGVKDPAKILAFAAAVRAA